MWDPLVHPFPESLHGFRCMLANQISSELNRKYSPDTVGHEFWKDFICIWRSKNYAEAFNRYSNVVANVDNTSKAQLRESVQSPCFCPHCPRHVLQAKVMDLQAHVSQAQDVQNVSKP
ncbi:precoat protein [Tomato leaf curl Philippines virus - [LB]]|uniref:Protein V2 n=1 Tax=Tomato leaf curl Philippines virus - [LB] TaxID=270142 RepID=Q9WPL9_9GEMI|nr:precoat protein [Tomato leaf curl Philippines virus - [LB]]